MGDVARLTSLSSVRWGVEPQQLLNMIAGRVKNSLLLALRMPFLGAKWGFQEKCLGDAGNLFQLSFIINTCRIQIWIFQPAEVSRLVGNR